jgi:hypothetical protein
VERAATYSEFTRRFFERGGTLAQIPRMLDI